MAFTLRRDTSQIVVRPSHISATEVANRGGSVQWSTWEVQENAVEEEKRRQNKRNSKIKGQKKKKRKRSIVPSVDEDLHIEFAELLEEPRTQYCPSLHGWREWRPRGEWIDPEQVRTETVSVLRETYQRLPTKPTGPPLP